MPKHVCTSEQLNQHVSINIMNNTWENVWLSLQKPFKYFAQIKSLSYHIFSPFLSITHVRRVGAPYPKSEHGWGGRRGADCLHPNFPLAQAAIPKGDRVQPGFLETHMSPHTPTAVASPVPRPPGRGPNLKGIPSAAELGNRLGKRDPGEF